MLFSSSSCCRVALVVLLSVAMMPSSGQAWEEEELEIFDLVEEVNSIEKNFYEYLELKNDATTGDIRKAYRRLAIVLHPDKNPAEDAEVKFRWLAGIYEVLKDKEKREIYDRVLVEGLPDWRMPIFYIRRMRKMNLAEGVVYLFLIVTVCQYFVNWAAYWERSWTLSEQVETHAKKMMKKVKKGQMEDMTEQLQAEELKLLGPKPTAYDTLPFQMYRGGKTLLFALPGLPSQIYAAYKEREEAKLEEIRLEKEEEAERERILEEKREKRERTKQNRQRKRVDQYVDRTEEYNKDSNGEKKPSKADIFKQPKNANQMWTDPDLTKLAKLVKKFPPGTQDRWEKVAEQLDRLPHEVTKMANKLKDMGFQVSVPKATQGVTGLESKKLIADDVMEYNNQVEDSSEEAEETDSDDENYGVYSCTTAEEYQPVEIKSKTKTKGGKKENNNEETSESSPEEVEWSQPEQKALEAALSSFPKGTEERWDRIASKVPGKTKEQCMSRFKALAAAVKEKKQQQQASA